MVIGIEFEAKDSMVKLTRNTIMYEELVLGHIMLDIMVKLNWKDEGI